MKKVTKLITLVLAILTVCGCFVSNAAAYTTYTYSIDGEPLSSPDAYTPEKVITSADLDLGDKPLNTPKDLYVDYNNRVYIADPKNNRILVVDKYFNRVIMKLTSFTNDQGVADSLNAPQGVFVTQPKGNDEGEIYVADTGNARIVVFKYDGTFSRKFEAPKSDVFDTDSVYKPIALAVDTSGRIYVVSETTYEGIIALNADGTFASILASQSVAADFFGALWTRFFGDADEEEEENLSDSFGNITIDSADMIYITSPNVDPVKQQSAIKGKDISGTFAPVKKLNPDGDDIMRRNGFYPPSGEVNVSDEYTISKSESDKIPTGASKIVDVAVGAEDTWSIVDQKRSHIFTYDKNGNLLFAFGDRGSQFGNFKSASAITYQLFNEVNENGEEHIEAKLLVLDEAENAITIYKRTEYGDILMTALEHTNNKEYDKAVDDWQEILKRNNNYDAAYVGIGNALYRDGKWEEAMDMFETAYDVENWSNAFKMYRKDLVAKWILLIVVVIVLVIFLISKFFGYAGKVNKRTALKKGKKTFGEEVLYAFHVIFHPFDGFWDLKREKRGSVRGATFWLAMVTISFIYQSFGTGAAVSGFGGEIAQDAITQAIGIAMPILLFVTANWCLTTLFEGEGSFKDVYIATCYAASPLSYLTLLSTIISQMVTSSETGFVSLINGTAWVWFGLLLFFGVMVTHDYSMAKNILTVFGTIIGMCVIMFVVVLFSGLLIKMTSFISNIITELSFRM